MILNSHCNVMTDLKRHPAELQDYVKSRLEVFVQIDKARDFCDFVEALLCSDFSTIM